MTWMAGAVIWSMGSLKPACKVCCERMLQQSEVVLCGRHQADVITWPAYRNSICFCRFGIFSGFWMLDVWKCRYCHLQIIVFLTNKHELPNVWSNFPGYSSYMDCTDHYWPGYSSYMDRRVIIDPATAPIRTVRSIIDPVAAFIWTLHSVFDPVAVPLWTIRP